MLAAILSAFLAQEPTNRHRWSFSRFASSKSSLSRIFSVLSISLSSSLTLSHSFNISAIASSAVLIKKSSKKELSIYLSQSSAGFYFCEKMSKHLRSRCQKWEHSNVSTEWKDKYSTSVKRWTKNFLPRWLMTLTIQLIIDFKQTSRHGSHGQRDHLWIFRFPVQNLQKSLVTNSFFFHAREAITSLETRAADEKPSVWSKSVSALNVVWL